MASKIKPPNASPKPKCVARMSAVLDNLIPANHIATELTPNMSSRIGNESDSIMKHILSEQLVKLHNYLKTLPHSHIQSFLKSFQVKMIGMAFTRIENALMIYI